MVPRASMMRQRAMYSSSVGAAAAAGSCGDSSVRGRFERLLLVHESSYLNG